MATDYKANRTARSEARKDRLKRKAQGPASQEARDAGGEISASPRGGFGVSPGGRGLESRSVEPQGPSTGEKVLKGGLSAAKSLAKPAGQLFDKLNAPTQTPFDRGTSEEAFLTQREGERGDFSSALTQPATMDGEQLWGSGQPLAPSLPNVDLTAADTTFSMPASSGAGAGIAPGASTGPSGAGAGGGMEVGGAGAAAAALLGAGLSGKQLADAIKAGSAPGMVGGALGLSAAALTTAAAAGSAAAQTALASAGPWLGVAAPVIVGALGAWQQAEANSAQNEQGRKMRGLTAPGYEATAAQGGRLGGLDPNAAQDPATRQEYFNQLARMFQTQDPNSGLGAMDTGHVNFAQSPLEYASAQANAGPNPSATGDNQAQMNEYGKSVMSGVPAQYQRMAYLLSQNPDLALPSWDIGDHKGGDIAKTLADVRAGGAQTTDQTYNGWFEHLPGTPEPYTQQQSGFDAPFIGPNPALGGQFSEEVLKSPFFAEEYWKSQGVTPQQAFMYGSGQKANQAGANIPLPSEGGFGAYDPNMLYQSLVKGGMQDLGPQQEAPAAVGGAGGGAGALPGAEGVGGAGKLSPTFVTPELDLRAEAVQGTGKLGGGRPGEGKQEAKPFGMSGRGGMGVGGGPRGNAPFGGAPRQTMMPQQGRGVQAGRKNQSGVV